MPTLRQLEYLVAVADVQHFGRAADVCHISQPSLSQQVRALEARLGVTLVERGQSGAKLTPIGRMITDRARRILVDAQDIREVARQAKKEMMGILRLGVSPTLGPYLLPPIVAALHREQPKLRLYIREGIPEDQALALSRGNLDILLGPLPIDGHDIETQPLFRERLFIVAAVDHPLAQCRDLTAGHLAGENLLSLDHRHHLHRQVAMIGADLGMTLLSDYEGTSLDSVHLMAASGMGLAVLPEFYVRSEVGGSFGITILNPTGCKFTRSIAAAWRSGAAYSPAYRAIADRIQADARAILAKVSYSTFHSG